MRAQKDMAVRVENNDDLKVFNDQTITIHNNRTEVVEQGNEKITIQQGNRDVTISMGNDSLKISMGQSQVDAPNHRGNAVDHTQGGPEQR